MNPNGVLFGQGAQVNVGSLVASTLDIGNEDFKADRYVFSGDSAAHVVNAGAITAATGGAVELMGAQVSNTGTIQAPKATLAWPPARAFSCASTMAAPSSCRSIAARRTRWLTTAV